VDAEKQAAAPAPALVRAAAAAAPASEGDAPTAVAKSANPDQTVTFEDIRSLQRFKDRVLLLDHVLRLNTGVFHDLQGLLVLLAEAPTLPPPALAACPGALGAEVGNLISRYISETQVSRHRTEHLLKRIEGASVLVRATLPPLL